MVRQWCVLPIKKLQLWGAVTLTYPDCFAGCVFLWGMISSYLNPKLYFLGDFNVSHPGTWTSLAFHLSMSVPPLPFFLPPGRCEWIITSTPGTGEGPPPLVGEVVGSKEWFFWVIQLSHLGWKKTMQNLYGNFKWNLSFRIFVGGSCHILFIQNGSGGF